MNEIQKDPNGVKKYEEVLGKPEDKPLIGVREFTVNHLFANVWSRSQLSIRDRRLITIALLAAQGCCDQLRGHIRAARIGEDSLSEIEILEIMIQVAHYDSWAAGTSGQKIALGVFKENPA